MKLDVAREVGAFKAYINVQNVIFTQNQYTTTFRCSANVCDFCLLLVKHFLKKFSKSPQG